MRSRCFRFPGFTLVEVTLAVGIAATSLIAIFALLVTGSQINHRSVEEAGSMEILTAVADDLRATPATSPSSVQFGIAIPPNPVGGGTSTTLFFDRLGESSSLISSSSRYRVTTSFLPTEAGHFATLATLRLTWPAAADPKSENTGAAEFFIALDRN